VQPEPHRAGVALVQQTGDDRLERDRALERRGTAPGAVWRSRDDRLGERDPVGAQERGRVLDAEPPLALAERTREHGVCGVGVDRGRRRRDPGGAPAPARVPRGVAEGTRRLFGGVIDGHA
jgi:hypothetical protein